ncbi:MAG TPA: acetone carboxylase subunit gamma [Candidatus Binataceae bacterium]|nr:acetone carboxylase subunit gamma [Candidatus Binataceae bacterium]
MNTYPKDLIRDLIDGRLPWPTTKQVMSDFKDAGRFETYIEILQERVSWQERILLPLGEHLYIVQKGKARIVKCDCGHEFGPYTENWKLSASIFVRDTDEKLEEIYPGARKCDPDWMEIREYCCPGCQTQLETEAVVPGYPIVFDFVPDLEAFYRDWLKKPLPSN